MLREIITRQKYEIKEKLKERLVERDIQEKVKKYLDKNIIKVITGARRAGKSTLAVLLLKDKNYAYVNFDEREINEYSSEEIEKVVREVYGDFKILFLDEIQNYNKWELWVNSLYRRGYNLIITGSNAKLLSSELATHLTGRYIEIEVFPFSFREYLKWFSFNLEDVEFLYEKQGKILNLLKKYMKYGGFPEVVTKDLDFEYLETLFTSILFKDIVRRYNIRNPSKLEELAIYLISNFSKEYTISKLANILEFRSKDTVEKYVSYLEEAYLIFSVQRFDFKYKEVIRAPRKVYCIDTGIINAVGYKISEDFGRLMENIVFLHLRRKYKNIFYYKTKSGTEIDFVIKEGTKIKEIIEVEYELDEKHIKKILDASQELNTKNLTIITWDQEDIIKRDNREVKVMPLWKWLLFY